MPLQENPAKLLTLHAFITTTLLTSTAGKRLPMNTNTFQKINQLNHAIAIYASAQYRKNSF